MRSLQTMTRSKQVKDSGKNALTFRPRLLLPPRFPSSLVESGEEDICSVSQTRRSPSLPHSLPPPPAVRAPDPLICRLSTRGNFATTDEAQKIHMSFFLCARATVSGGPGERGESAAMISATAFALSPSLGLNYENGIVTFHSPSNGPSAERGGEKDIGRAGGPRGGRTEELLSTAYYSLSGFDSAPRALQSHHGSGHSFHLLCSLSLRIYCPLEKNANREA